MVLQRSRTILSFLCATAVILIVTGCASNSPQSTRKSITPPYTFIASSGKTTGPLTIRSIELKFQNGLGDITLDTKTPPQPEAIIKFDGNGLFQASWQVDGQNIEPVGMNVSFGKTLKLRLVNTSQIATFQPGQHHISLKIISPQTSLTVPTITYFIQMQ